MSEAEDLTPAPTRVGSSADLARRMDKMEGRQDTLESEVRALTATVARVELNQNHATDLAKMTFNALDSGLKVLDGRCTMINKRIEGIISGEIETAQGRQGAAIMAEYLKWREDTIKRLDAVEDAQKVAVARSGGIATTLSWGKTALLASATLAAPIIAAAAILSRP